EVRDIDLARRQVICEATQIDYDFLIVATGATHSYFGKDHWAPHAPGLKRLADATEIRQRILMSFERAELASSAQERAREMTFVIVGGGPTGVEMAGAIAELAQYTLVRDFRRISSMDARVVLIEAGPRLLSSFPENLSDKARRQLESRGVEVWLNTPVEDLDAEGVLTSKGRLSAATKVWGAGVKVDHLARWLDCETDRAGRVAVAADLSLPGHNEVFVIGDAAKVVWRAGKDVPGIAPAAKQEGRYVAQRIASQFTGKGADNHAAKPFRYRHRGNLATIGRHAAVIDFGWIRLSGAFAWWLWGIAHIFFLIGVRKPVMVALSWTWSYLTHAKGARLITSLPKRHLEPPKTAKQAQSQPQYPAPTPGE
ncbi:MAG: NAD(P)/FAD-dependent oxidoreductase, partial [Pseudomonadota bacterium]